MQRLLLLIAVLLVSPLASGQRALEAARRASELLGPEVWSQVLQIDCRGAACGHAHPLHATVFELGGLLWLYEPDSGTQSLSLHRDNLAAEKADLGPLLRAVEPGSVGFRVLAAASARFDPPAALPNGCFIESYAAWRERRAAEGSVLEARLLSYYVLRSGRLEGHTVLTYATPEGVFVLDPASEDRTPRQIDGVALTDAAEVAAVLRADLRIAKARWVPANLLGTPAATGGATMRYGRADKAG